MGSRIEAVFGGVLVLAVIAAAIFALASGPTGSSAKPKRVAHADNELLELIQAAEPGECYCYDAAFDLAGSSVDVMSSQYRTGYEHCRADGEDQARAWTAGWNARLSARPYEASCRAYIRSARVSN
ncbi:MAG: hypothetical protein AAFX08_09610 [Pseudomonadota bacterium]